MSEPLNICMIGAGYVGLVSAACFSEFGWNVHCVDKDRARVEQLNKGEIPIFEPGLDDLLERNLTGGRLIFSTDLEGAVSQSQLIFLAVGTPMRRGDGHADLSYVYTAIDELAPHLRDFTVITTKSTVPVGTSREIEQRLKALRPDAEFAVCSNPEFLREGSAIYDFTHPDRVLIGCDDDRARKIMEQIYEPLTLRNSPILIVGRETAELAKYAANAFLAMKISFINEIADLCEQVDANVQHVATAIGADQRIGSKFLHPGPGYGGSCFPKDVAALIRIGREYHRPLSLVEQVKQVNDERKIAMTNRIVYAAGGDVKDRTIAVLGITFKPNTDDIREAPSLTIVPMLIEKGAKLKIYDPQGRAQAGPEFEGVEWCNSALEAASGADLVALLTEWNEFRAINLDSLKSRMNGNIMVDLRNLYSVENARQAGFDYYSVGRK